MARTSELDQIVGGGSDIVVDPNGNGDYLTIQEALDAVPSGGGDIYVAGGTYTLTSPLVIKKSRTNLRVSDGATIQANMNIAAFTGNPMISPDVGVAICTVRGGKWYNTYSVAAVPTVSGTAFDFSNSSNNVIAPTRVELFDTFLVLNDTSSLTFYNIIERTQVFDCKNGISILGTQANANSFRELRIKPKSGAAGTALNVVDCRGATFHSCDFEAASATGITGIHLDGTCRHTVFVNCWMENNFNNIVLDSGCRETVFIGCTMHNETGAGTPIVDNGTNTILIGTEISDGTGTERHATRIAKTTDLSNHTVWDTTETASAVNNVRFINAATGNAPQIGAVGTDSNIDLQLTPKGTGAVKFEGPTKYKETTAPTNIAGYGFVYVKASDSKLYYKNAAGTEFDLTAAGGAVTDYLESIRYYAKHDAGTTNNTPEFNMSGTATTPWAVQTPWDATAIGVVRGNLGVANNNTLRFDVGSNMVRLGSGAAIYNMRIQIPTLSTGTDTYTIRAGLMNSLTAEPANGVYFRYTDGTNSGKFQCVTRASSTETATDSGITAATGTTYKFEIIVNAAGTSVEFKINGATVATNTTNIPASSSSIGYGLGLIRTAGTNQINPIDVDYQEFYYTFTTPR